MAALMALAPTGAFGQVKQLLEFRPTVKGVAVDYDTPKDAAAIEACKSEVTTKPSGYVLRDGQGKVLRRFLDLDTNRKLDQWSYYQDGFEVYREVDLDGDKSIDEVRWLNNGGTRIATVKDNVISGWKRLSAEEASKVLVQAIASKDIALLETVMATPEELAALGIPAAEADRVKAGAAKRATAVAELWKGLVGWDQTTVWMRLDAAMPHVIPVDATAGLKDDLTLYENAVIFAGSANPAAGQADKTAFLQASELIKVGNTWKFVDLPRAINPANQAPVVAMEGGVRSTIYRDSGSAGPAEDPAMAASIKALADYDKTNAEMQANADKKIVARYYIGRARLLRDVVASATKPEDKLFYDKQVVDSISGAYQTGEYAEGRKVLDAVEAKGGKLGSYSAYRRITAEFALSNEDANANMVVVQKKWMTSLKEFLEKYAASDEAPDVLFQLASNNEFNAEEKEARDYYTKLAETHADTDQGKKATGALRRLDIVGKPLVLKGKSADGQAVDVAQYRGKVTLVTFWATWARPVKRDMPEIAKIYEKNRAKGFEIIGVCLDNEKDKALMDEFLKANNLAWTQIFEPGGMESRLATEFGIISLPTMILVDAEGKVINRNIRTAADLDVQLEKVLTAKAGPGVARGGDDK
jgi:thiol-disulfide isomerase/thioredoxin